MNRLCHLLAVAFIIGTTIQHAEADHMTATVVEFGVRGGLPEEAGVIIADLMLSAIADTGRFTLKDRLSLSALFRIGKVQELGSTGLLNFKSAAVLVKLGQLYGVDAVVIGEISKLGDLITVTARLIDTKTASLLGSGQIQDRNIDAVQVKLNKLAAMITAPPNLAPQGVPYHAPEPAAPISTPKQVRQEKPHPEPQKSSKPPPKPERANDKDGEEYFRQEAHRVRDSIDVE